MLKKIILCTTIFGLNFIVAGNNQIDENLVADDQEQHVVEQNDPGQCDKIVLKKRASDIGLVSKFSDIRADLQQRVSGAIVRENRMNKGWIDYYTVAEMHKRAKEIEQEFFDASYEGLMSRLNEVNARLSKMGDIMGDFVLSDPNDPESIDFAYCLGITSKLLRMPFFATTASSKLIHLFDECSVVLKDLDIYLCVKSSYMPVLNKKIHDAFTAYINIENVKYAKLYLKKLLMHCQQYYMLQNGLLSSEVILKEVFEDVIDYVDEVY